MIREGYGTPLQCSCLENPMDGGAWWASVHGVARSRTWLNDFTFTFHFHALEKEMATHSSVLTWRIPGTREPGGLPSMGSHRAGHDWRDLAAAAARLVICFQIDLESVASSLLSALLSHPFTLVWMLLNVSMLFFPWPHILYPTLQLWEVFQIC